MLHTINKDGINLVLIDNFGIWNISGFQCSFSFNMSTVEINRSMSIVHQGPLSAIIYNKAQNYPHLHVFAQTLLKH